MQVHCMCVAAHDSQHHDHTVQYTTYNVLCESKFRAIMREQMCCPGAVANFEFQQVSRVSTRTATVGAIFKQIFASTKTIRQPD